MFMGELPSPREVPFAWSTTRTEPCAPRAAPDQSPDGTRHRIDRLAATVFVALATLAVSALMLVLAAHAEAPSHVGPAYVLVPSTR
jgi:hypothetical protein